MDDYIKRGDALEQFDYYDLDEYLTPQIRGILEDIPSADVEPVRHEEDGTLWVTVGDCEKVGRVIVKNEREHFCRVFYMGDGDEEPVRHGRWVFAGDNMFECLHCGVVYTRQQLDGLRNYDTDHCVPNYCPNCGAKMYEENKDEL